MVIRPWRRTKRSRHGSYHQGVVSLGEMAIYHSDATCLLYRSNSLHHRCLAFCIRICGMCLDEISIWLTHYLRDIQHLSFRD